MREERLIDALRKTELTVHRARFVKLNSSWNFTTHGSPYTRLYFVTDGSGFLKTEDTYIKMQPQNVYIIPPNCKFSCGCEYLEKIFFHINISTIEKYDLFFNLKGIYSMPCDKATLENIKTLLYSDNYIDILTLKMILIKTVTDFVTKNAIENKSVKKHSELIQSVIGYIENNVTVKLTVSDISKALFISESKIRNAFKEEMNMPIGKYIDDMIFIKARQLLTDEKRAIASVSSELGFCDQFYFSRRFKEKFSVTPSKFKKTNK